MIRKCWLLCFCLGVSGVFGVPVASAQACTATWTGSGGDGLWNTAANWSPAAVPGNGNTPDVCLPDIGHSYTVTLEPSGSNGGYTVNSLTIGAASGSNIQTLAIVGQSFTFQGETQNGEGLGVLTGGTVNATGSLVLDSTSGGGRALPSDPLGGPAGFGHSPFGGPVGGGQGVNNFGHILAENSDPAWNEDLNANVTNEPGGSITVASGSLDQQTSNTVTNDGTVTVDPGADYDVTSGGTIDDFTNDGAVANNGTFEVGGQTGTFTQNGAVTGNPVSIEASAILADQSGGGVFTLEFGTPVLTGTIPAGQTVDVVGASDIYQGETQNGTTLSLGNTAVTNNGTLVLDATTTGTKALPGDTVGGGVTLASGSLTNNGTLDFKVDDPAWINDNVATVTNSHAGSFTISGGLSQSQGGVVANDGAVTLSPSAHYLLLEGGSFTNRSDGTLASQIGGMSSFGTVELQSPCCAGPGVFTSGGTLTPALVGGFAPAAGQEFDLFALNGGQFAGTFGAVGTGFTADYAHESASPAFVGVVYHAPSGGHPGGGSAPGTVHVGRIAGGSGRLTVALSCSAGGAACRAVSVAATATKPAKKQKKKKKKKGKARKKPTTVGVASGHVTLRAGAKKTLTLTLGASGRALLAKYGSIAVKVKVNSGGKTLKTVTVRVHKPAKAKKKH